MSTPIVGVFKNERTLAEAVSMLHSAGVDRRDLYALSQHPLQTTDLYANARCVCVKDLREPGEVQFRESLRGALWGSIIVFLLSVAVAPLWFDGIWMQVFFVATVWKFGSILGLYVGIFMGSDRGLQKETVLRYLEYLAYERLVLVVNVREKHTVNVRGIFLECGVLEIEDVKGTFEPVAKGAKEEVIT